MSTGADSPTRSAVVVRTRSAWPKSIPLSRRRRHRHHRHPCRHRSERDDARWHTGFGRTCVPTRRPQPRPERATRSYIFRNPSVVIEHDRRSCCNSPHSVSRMSHVRPCEQHRHRRRPARSRRGSVRRLPQCGVARRDRWPPRVRRDRGRPPRSLSRTRPPARSLPEIGPIATATGGHDLPGHRGAKLATADELANATARRRGPRSSVASDDGWPAPFGRPRPSVDRPAGGSEARGAAPPGVGGLRRVARRAATAAARGNSASSPRATPADRDGIEAGARRPRARPDR